MTEAGRPRRNQEPRTATPSRALPLTWRVSACRGTCRRRSGVSARRRGRRGRARREGIASLVAPRPPGAPTPASSTTAWRGRRPGRGSARAGVVKGGGWRAGRFRSAAAPASPTNPPAPLTLPSGTFSMAVGAPPAAEKPSTRSPGPGPGRAVTPSGRPASRGPATPSTQTSLPDTDTATGACGGGARAESSAACAAASFWPALRSGARGTALGGGPSGRGRARE